MRTATFLPLCAAAIGACAPTVPAPVLPLAGEETSIPYAANGGIRDWYSNNEMSIYLRDRADRWYFARFSAPCPNLPATQGVRFETDASGTFDRYNSVISDFANCQVVSIVRSAAPAAKGGLAR